IEHALRHTHVQDAAAGNPRVAGAIGWCAFDYNTHGEFGSGDRICYHGVMDIFRLPKPAAALYESQIAPSVRPVVVVASYRTMGDLSVGGHHTLWIYSNCHEIEVVVHDSAYGRFQPNREAYPHLAHPPFKVEGLKSVMTWGR